MADEREETTGNATEVAAAEQRRAGLSRRALLRGATAAVPTILTLKSGTALAVASSHIAATDRAPPFNGHYATLDTTGDTDGSPYEYRGRDVWYLPADGLYVDVSDLDENQKKHLLEQSQTIPLPGVPILGAGEICDRAGDTTEGLATFAQVKQVIKQNGTVEYFSLGKIQPPQCAYLSMSSWHSINASGQVLSDDLPFI